MPPSVREGDQSSHRLQFPTNTKRSNLAFWLWGNFLLCRTFRAFKKATGAGGGGQQVNISRVLRSLITVSLNSPENTTCGCSSDEVSSTNWPGIQLGKNPSRSTCVQPLSKPKAFGIARFVDVRVPSPLKWPNKSCPNFQDMLVALYRMFGVKIIMKKFTHKEVLFLI